MAGAIHGDAGQARALIDPYQVSHFQLPGGRGVCPECGAGRLWATLYLSDSDKRASMVACDAQGCAKVWWSLNWRRMGELILRREAMAS